MLVNHRLHSCKAATFGTCERAQDHVWRWLTRDACVGHVRVHTVTAVPGWASACASRNGLVVAHGGVTKREVVHAALQQQQQQQQQQWQ
jgi:hypothetical protein